MAEPVSHYQIQGKRACKNTEDDPSFSGDLQIALSPTPTSEQICQGSNHPQSHGTVKERDVCQLSLSRDAASSIDYHQYFLLSFQISDNYIFFAFGKTLQHALQKGRSLRLLGINHLSSRIKLKEILREQACSQAPSAALSMTFKSEFNRLADDCSLFNIICNLNTAAVYSYRNQY